VEPCKIARTVGRLERVEVVVPCRSGCEVEAAERLTDTMDPVNIKAER
jgi:hypothetical protein